LWLERSWGEVKNVSMLVAIGAAQTGYREILAVNIRSTVWIGLS